MCELLAISSKLATTVSLSLDQFAGHGNNTGENKDGWGVVYYGEKDIRRFRDIGPAADSEWVKFVEKQALCSTLFLAHIRHANMGAVRLANTHPFARELGGSMHTFAHNGFLQNMAGSSAFELGQFRPVGNTDSEWAFCTLLDRLIGVWMAEHDVPSIGDRYKVVSAFASDVRDLGLANFIYSDGDAVFVHADRRRQTDGEFREPGLWLKQVSCPGDAEKVRGGGVKIDSPKQVIAMAASVPLTKDGWEPMEAGSLVVLKDGEIGIAT